MDGPHPLRTLRIDVCAFGQLVSRDDERRAWSHGNPSDGIHISNATQTAQTAALATAASASARLRAARINATTVSKRPRQPIPRLRSSVSRRVSPLAQKVITGLGGGSVTKNAAYKIPSKRRTHAKRPMASAIDVIFDFARTTRCALTIQTDRRAGDRARAPLAGGPVEQVATAHSFWPKIATEEGTKQPAWPRARIPACSKAAQKEGQDLQWSWSDERKRGHAHPDQTEAPLQRPPRRGLSLPKPPQQPGKGYTGSGPKGKNPTTGRQSSSRRPRRHGEPLQLRRRQTGPCAACEYACAAG